MHKLYKLIVLSSFSLGFVSVADAAELRGMGVAVKAGTLGYGLELTKSYNDKFSARVGFNTLTVTDSMTQDDVDYDADLELSTIAAIGDYHPFGGGFRLSLGYVVNNNEFKMTAQPTAATYSIGNAVYNTADLATLKGTVSFSNGFLVGLGWGSAGTGEGLGFSLDLAVLAQGSPKFDLTGSGNVTDPSHPAYDPNFQSNLAAEEQQAEDDMSEFTLYPALSVGISYSF